MNIINNTFYFMRFLSDVSIRNTIQSTLHPRDKKIILVAVGIFVSLAVLTTYFFNMLCFSDKKIAVTESTKEKTGSETDSRTSDKMTTPPLPPQKQVKPASETKTPVPPSTDTFKAIDDLPGTWYMMDKSQVSLKTPSGCTVYALKTISNLLACEEKLDVVAQFEKALTTMAPVIQKCDPEGTMQYDLTDIVSNEEYSKHLGITHNLTPETFVCDPFTFINCPIDNQTTCSSRVEVLNSLFDAKGDQPFAAAVLGGPETLAIYQRHPNEIYLFDSHKPAITVNGNQTNFEQAYIGKFNSKEDLTYFLLQNRFFYEAEVEDTARLQITIIERNLS